MAEDFVRIFDTTLRDGEQSAGVNLNTAEKIQIAHQLARAKVDVIEAGFPAASPGDLDAVRRIAREVGGPIIAGLARTRKEDLDAAYEAVKDAAKPRIHTFIATSDIHLEYKLKMTRQEVLEEVRRGVSHARSLVEDVEFSAEDASRSDPEFLAEVFRLATECGATTLNIPDTVGYSVPDRFGSFVKRIIDLANLGNRVIWSCHCHNDLGLATANSVEAVRAGVRQIECAVNGLGERAGNAALEESVMALRTRSQHYGVDTRIDSTKLCGLSSLVSRLTGFSVPPNKAIVGANAFAHEAGIHQHGVLCNKETYEIMRPEDVGASGTKLVMGKHSGKHAFQDRVSSLGFNLNKEEIAQGLRHLQGSLRPEGNRYGRRSGSPYRGRHSGHRAGTPVFSDGSCCTDDRGASHGNGYSFRRQGRKKGRRSRKRSCRCHLRRHSSDYRPESRIAFL